MRTSGNPIFVPLGGKDAPTLGFEIFPIGGATPFDDGAPAVAICEAVAIEVLSAVTVLL